MRSSAWEKSIYTEYSGIYFRNRFWLTIYFKELIGDKNRRKCEAIYFLNIINVQHELSINKFVYFSNREWKFWWTFHQQICLLLEKRMNDVDDDNEADGYDDADNCRWLTK